jgi:uncharacterized membrane protein YgcG
VSYLASAVSWLQSMGIEDELVAFFLVLLAALGLPVLLVLIVIRRITGVAWEGGTTSGGTSWSSSSGGSGGTFSGGGGSFGGGGSSGRW